jgi:hypothetical protein
LKDKLRPSQTVGITGEDCFWHRHGNVTCNKWVKVFLDDKMPISGRVRSKYIQPYADAICECEVEAAERPVAAAPKNCYLSKPWVA